MSPVTLRNILDDEPQLRPATIADFQPLEADSVAYQFKGQPGITVHVDSSLDAPNVVLEDWLRDLQGLPRRPKEEQLEHDLESKWRPMAELKSAHAEIWVAYPDGSVRKSLSSSLYAKHKGVKWAYLSAFTPPHPDNPTPNPA